MNVLESGYRIVVDWVNWIWQSEEKDVITQNWCAIQGNETSFERSTIITQNVEDKTQENGETEKKVEEVKKKTIPVAKSIQERQKFVNLNALMLGSAPPPIRVKKSKNAHATKKELTYPTKDRPIPPNRRPPTRKALRR